MVLIGLDFLEQIAGQQTAYSAKMIINDEAAVFFSGRQQHREVKLPQISYEDDYAGNALAAMVSPGRIEIRYHQDFEDSRVVRILRSLMEEPRLQFMRDWQFVYQGRTLALHGGPLQ